MDGFHWMKRLPCLRSRPMRMARYILPLFAFVLASCLETVDPVLDICFDTNQIVGIGVISKTRVEEVKVYTVDNILCESNHGLFFRKNKDEKLYRYSSDTTVNSEQDDWFFSIGCWYYDEEMENKQVAFQITKDDGINVLDLEGFLVGKTNVFVILEQDTAWLFSYSGSMVNDGGSSYNFSPSTRMGCRGGYCFVSLPIWEREVCFEEMDKSTSYLFE